MEQTLPPSRAETNGSPESAVAGAGIPDPLISADEISAEIARFSRLSYDLTEFLSGLSRKIQGWMAELNGIQSQIDLKKEELKRLHEIEAASATLEQLREEQRSRKESFESLMASERRNWDEEKARRRLEEEQYIENLRVQRQREEEEHRQRTAAEEQQARQRLEEELQSLREENRLKLEALEREFAQRELVLKEKETEWTQLVQELEQFMSRLANRTRSHVASPPASSAPGSD